MIVSNGSLKKKRIKKNLRTSQLCIEDHRYFDSMYAQCMEQGSTRALIEYLKCYNLENILQALQNLDNTQKQQTLHHLSLHSYPPSTSIQKFQPQTQLSEFHILLKGQLSYKLKLHKCLYSIPYLTKPGQILLQPYDQQQLEYKAFGLVAQSQCLVLKVRYQSRLREILWGQRQQYLGMLMKAIWGCGGQWGVDAVAAIVPYFSEFSCKLNQNIFPEKSTITYLCYIAHGQIQISKPKTPSPTPTSSPSINIRSRQITKTNKTSHQFFLLSQNQSYTMVCRSQKCFIYAIPAFILSKTGMNDLYLQISQQDEMSRAFREAVFEQWIKVGGSGKSKKGQGTRGRTRGEGSMANRSCGKWSAGNSGEKRRTKKMGQIGSSDSWDLIGYTIQKEKQKRRPLSRKTTSFLQNKKSQHRTRTQSASVVMVGTKSVPLLKRPEQQCEVPIFCDSLHHEPSSRFRNYVKSGLHQKSAYLSEMKKVSQSVSKNRLVVKATKYRLLGYAKQDSYLDYLQQS